MKNVFVFLKKLKHYHNMNDDFVPGFLSYNLQINYRNKYLPYKHLPHKQNKYKCVQNKSAKALHFFPCVIEPTYE